MPASCRHVRRARALLPLMAAGILLAACTPLPEPFLDMRREAGTTFIVGSSTLDRPAVCYNTANATADDVKALANAACAETGRVAVYESSDIAHCTVLHPHRSFFRCVEPEVPVKGVSGVQIGPLGVRVPGAEAPTAENEPAEGENPGVPDLPPAPERPLSPDGEGMLSIFE